MIAQRIGEGNTAEVFLWGDNDILKLFRKGMPMVAIEQEYRSSKAVEELGLPTPKVKDMLEYEGRTGIIYEKISGESLLKLLTTKPWSVGRIAKTVAKLHYAIHQQRAQGIPDCVEELRWKINHVESLSQGEKEEVLKVLELLPKGNSICHCDYHPGNIIQSNNRCVVLDWMTATAGRPAFDVARTMYLIKDAALPDYFTGMTKLFMNIIRRYLANRYLLCYRRLSGMQQEELDAWRLPLIAARLTEWIPDNEKKAILTEIKEKIGV